MKQIIIDGTIVLINDIDYSYLLSIEALANDNNDYIEVDRYKEELLNEYGSSIPVPP